MLDIDRLCIHMCVLRCWLKISASYMYYWAPICEGQDLPEPSGRRVESNEKLNSEMDDMEDVIREDTGQALMSCNVMLQCNVCDDVGNQVGGEGGVGR